MKKSGINMELTDGILKCPAGAFRLPISFTLDGEKQEYPACTVSAAERPDAALLCRKACVRLAGGVGIYAEYTEYQDYPVTEWLFYIKNEGSEPHHIKDVRVGGLIEGKGECTLVHGNGDTQKDEGYSFSEDKLEGPLSLTPADGTSCKGAFPYFKLLFEDREVRAAIGWSSKWIAEFEPEDGGVRLFCGQDRCDTDLYPGEEWRTPRLTLMCCTRGDGNYRGINTWRRWYLAHILPRTGGIPVPPLHCMHQMGVDGHPEATGTTEENQIAAIDGYIKRGLKPDVWWLDAGWYPCDYQWTHTGTWHCDPERFPRGLGVVGEYCNDKDIRFLLWFEPERTQPGTELINEHPEWFLSVKNTENWEGKNRLLNLGNADALEWLEKHVDGLIKEYGIRIYRQDFNFNPRPYWCENEPENRTGFLENRHISGYYAYWDYLRAHNPGLLIDSCASGGRRNDLETMRRAVTLHYTDAAYGNHPIKQRQFREMFEWIPYFRSHNMSWDNPEDGSYGKQYPHISDEFSFMNAMAPSLTTIMRYTAPDEEFATAVRMEKVWRQAAALELSGDYYPLTECRGDPQDWYVCQFDDERAHRGVIIAIRNTQAEESFDFVPACIRNGAVYSFKVEGTGASVVAGGRELAPGGRAGAKALQNGMRLTLPVRSGTVIFYKYSGNEAVL